jgi:hypothetical protein
VEGRLAVEIEGVECVITPEDGEFPIKPWTNHRLYPLPQDGGETKVTFLLSGENTDETYKLDELFFLNWYGYQDAVFVYGEPLRLMQIMSVGHIILSCTARETRISHLWPDVRRRRLLLVASHLDPILSGHCSRYGHYPRQVDRSAAWLSTISQEMEQ